MKFLRFINNAFNNRKKNSQGVNSDSSSENTLDSKKFKFPLWIFGGGFGCFSISLMSFFVVFLAVFI